MKRLISVVLAAALVLLLCACGSKAAAGYTVRVVDEKGNGIGGVILQVCNDRSCGLQETDDKGSVRLVQFKGDWEVHVTEVPEGYAVPTETYLLSAKTPKVTVTLNASGS